VLFHSFQLRSVIALLYGLFHYFWYKLFSSKWTVEQGDKNIPGSSDVGKPSAHEKSVVGGGLTSGGDEKMI
jgi:hypothetical protein